MSAGRLLSTAKTADYQDLPFIHQILLTLKSPPFCSDLLVEAGVKRLIGKLLPREAGQKMGFSATILLLPLGGTCHAQRLWSHIHIWGRVVEEENSVTEALEIEHSAVSLSFVK